MRADRPRAPSYFSQFFEDQLRQQNDDGAPLRTLYIDRDPATFRDISLHLQGWFYYLFFFKALWIVTVTDKLDSAGYHVRPRDGPHFVKLFADAQFYSRTCDAVLCCTTYDVLLSC